MNRSKLLSGILWCSVLPLALSYTTENVAVAQGSDDVETVPQLARFMAGDSHGVAPFTVSFRDISSGGTLGITRWKWDFGDGSVSSEQNPVHTYRESGFYTVSLTVSSHEGADTVTETDYISVAGEGALMTVLPNFIQFGYVPVGQTRTKSLTIRNEGTGLLLGKTHARAPFAIEGNPAFSVAAGGSMVITVSYSPTEAESSEAEIRFVAVRGASVSASGMSIAPEPGIRSGVRINETAPWNTNGLQDGAGNYVDWIELYNENDVAVNLGGWCLTDDRAAPRKFVFPSGTAISAKGFIVVFATTNPSRLREELHTGFALDEVNGGFIGLFAPGVSAIVGEVDYPAMEKPNMSYAFFEDLEEPNGRR